MEYDAVMYREAPARRTVTIAYRSYRGERVVFSAGLLLFFVGFMTFTLVRGERAPWPPLIIMAVLLLPFVVGLVIETRQIAVTIDHRRGVVSFKPGLLSARVEIAIAQIEDVELETGTSVESQTARAWGGSSRTPVGRICLVVEDDKVPIENRMRPDLDEHRHALNRIRAALKPTRPGDDD
jgi:hypothetical protein